MVQKEMKLNRTAVSALSFIIGYLAFFYICIFLGIKMYSENIESSWHILGDLATKLKCVLLIYPAISVLFSCWASSISIMSYSAMGSEKMNSAKFFGIGYFWFLICNFGILAAGLQLFIDKEIGMQWLKSVGEMPFKFFFQLLAPSLGFIGGILFNIVFNKMIEALQS